MGEYSAMCEKILHKLYHIITTNAQIQEFSIISASENEKNKSPVIYEQNCLGLESWCKKYLLHHCHMTLFQNHGSLLHHLLPVESMKKINNALIGALLIHPSVTTFWNMKRELVQSKTLTIEQELYFSKIVLSQHAKCSEIFAYRRWLINMLPEQDSDLNFLNNELNLCKMSAEKSQNNYHSWNHRIWCIERFLENCVELDEVFLSELNFSINWITKHVSEYSGYYYRQILIQKMPKFNNVTSRVYQNLGNFKDIIKYLKLPDFDGDPFLVLHYLLGKSNALPVLEDCPTYVSTLAVLLTDLLYISNDLNFLYEGHESLWHYRRFIIICIIKIIYEYHGKKFTYNLSLRDENISTCGLNNMFSYDMNSVVNITQKVPSQIFSSNLYNSLINSEKEFIENNKISGNINQNNLASRHLRWLKCTNFYSEGREGSYN